MKRFYFSKLVILAALFLGFNVSSMAQTTTYSYTGGIAYYTVPAGISQISVDMAGAKGGTNYGSYQIGGNGGRVQGYVAVTPGQVLGVYVGRSPGSISCCTINNGGDNGSGYTGGSGYYYGNGGGGCSEVRIAPYSNNNTYRTMVAGGGGGAGYDCSNSDYGGDGGGLTAANGKMCNSYNNCYNGVGGNQTSGGTAAACWGAGNGSIGNGGACYTGYYYAGGGGAGYYGGSGSYYYGGGGGGSSYTDPLYVSNVTHTQGYYTTVGSGYVSITPLYPLVVSNPPSLTFPLQTAGTPSIPQFVSLTGVRLTGFPTTLSITGPTSGFLLSNDGVNWGTSTTMSVTSANLGPVNLYVQFVPGFATTYSGNIVITGAGQPFPCTIPINGTGVAACSALPVAGTASVSPTTAGVATPITLSLTGATVGGSIGYQWQQSFDAGLTWSNINGAVFATSSILGISANTSFRCLVTCPGSGTSTSTVAAATFAAAALTASSCTPTCGNTLCCGFYVATSSNPFVLNGDGGTKINDNISTGSSTKYYDQTTGSSPMSVNLTIGNSYTCTNNYVASNPNSFQMWIDYNNNGIFDPTESVCGVNWSAGTAMPVVPLTIASNATAGTFRMRVSVEYATNCSINYPCYPNLPPCPTSTQGYAETRDYIVNLAYPNCSGTPNPGISFIPVTNGCGPYNSNFYSVGAVNSFTGITYNWQSSPDNIAWSDIGGASIPVYTQSVTATMYYRNRATCALGGTATTPSTLVTYNIQPVPITGTTTFCSANPSQLSDGTPGGVWSSSNLAIATVGSTGLVTGLSGGTATISYRMPTGCSATTVVTIYQSPKAITGATNLCTTVSSSLTDAIGGGVWTSSNNSFASIGSTSGIVSPMAPGSPVITYTIPAGGCFVTLPITVNTLPAPITGTSSVCVGSTTTLSDPTGGGTWVSSSSFLASVSSTGLVTGALAGNPTISYTLPGGCSATMPVVVNPLPLSITGTSNACVGATTALTDATAGGAWTSSNLSVATVGTGNGLVTGIAAGAANIIYRISATGCSISLPVNVNILPSVFSITGGGGFCSGTGGTHVGLNGSTTGVDYTLSNGSTPVITLHGSNSGLDFGLMTAVGTYTVQAVNTTTGCPNNMTGIATVSVNPLPNPYTLTAAGTGAYCAGGTGVNLMLSGSDAGVSYQVMMGATKIGSAIMGTGALTSLNLGSYTLAGTYNVVATNVSTLCTNNMTGTATISINMPPVVYPITGSGTSYCANTAGIDISMSAADANITYALLNGGSVTSSIATTASGPIDFSYQKVAGTYTVRATDVNNCVSMMSGSVAVSINPLPAMQTVTGGGAFCAGGTGKHIGLLSSVTGVSYSLWNSAGLVSTVGGSNSSIDFGSPTATGTYFVVATNGLSCTDTMTSTASISVNPVPNPYSLNGGGGFCVGLSDTVGMSSTDPGIHYQLFNNGSVAGPFKTGTGGEMSFGKFTAPGTYTVVATNNVTGCTSNMPGSVVVSVNSLPKVYTVGGGGGYCLGDLGADVYISNTEPGLTYNLTVGGVATPYSGLGGPLDFGLQPVPGTYTVVALNPVTNCQSNMAGSATVSINPLPINYTITGATSYCAGGSGVAIGNSLSTKGVDYALLNAGAPTGVVLGGTGSALNFGIFPAGAYSVKATNTATTCNNTGSTLTVNVNPLPNDHTVTFAAPFTGPTASICSSDTGSHILLTASDASASYQLYKGTSKIGSSMAGGAPIDFGLTSVPGTYTVLATDNTSHCSVAMSASAVLNVTPSPAVYMLTGSGSRCAADPGVKFYLSNSDLGTQYTVFNAGVPDGSFWAGTGLPIYVGAHRGAGTYKVVATNPSTGCKSNMADSATVVIRASNIPFVMIDTTITTGTICDGKSVTFSVIDSNTGTLPAFAWKVNSIAAGTGSTFTYAPANGDIVSVSMTSNVDCPAPATVSNTLPALTVMPSSLPTVSVNATPGTFVCPGTAVTLHTTATSSGAAPVYTWIKNGATVSTGSTYTFTPTDSAIVFCALASNYQCRTSDYVLSNNVTVSINEPILPMFMISDISSTSVNKGGVVILKAIVSNAGSFTYQWYVHGNLIANATNPTFSYNYYNDQEVVKCVVTSHGVCGGLSTAQSTLISVRDNTGVSQLNTASDIRVMPNPNKGAFTVKGSLGTTLDEEVTLEITNMLGQVVYKNKVMAQGGMINEQVQLSNTLANGMYLLNVRSGSETSVFHFVIEQ